MYIPYKAPLYIKYRSTRNPILPIVSGSLGKNIILTSPDNSVRFDFNFLSIIRNNCRPT